MNEISIIYWTGTGNTMTMAGYVAEGIKEGGKIPRVFSVDDIAPSQLRSETIFALGCPAMGAEVLEESVMEPFVEELESFVAGKTVALFGSYGWGDGEWMRNWVERMEKAGAKVIGGEDAICQEVPDEDAQEELKSLGKELAAL
ncbi:flavodoxin [Anaerostipes faecalis]|uniref:flavodoxin n=1 Tax=Anaerostipes faecalis TaxID=2738446 RepID=UPI003F03DD5C